MPSVRLLMGASLLLFAGCHRDDSEAGVIKHTLNWSQGPNTEIQDCHIFKLDNPDPVEVSRIHINFPSGSHHVHMYRSETPVPDSALDCWSGIDWTVWHLVLGAQTAAMDWRLPEGLTVPLDPNQQLLVQVHWLNTTEAPITEKVDISFHTTTKSDAHVGVMFGINKQVAMEAHERKVIKQWCPMPEGTKLLAMMGHFHGLGQKYTVVARPETSNQQGALYEGEGETIYEALGEQTFQFKSYTPPYAIKPGDGLEFECDFFNYRNHPIVWSADVEKGEHCNMSAYYYPAGDDLSQFCFIEKPEIAELKGPATRVMPNDDMPFTITLNEDAIAGGAEVRLEVSNPNALSLPATVTIPEGQSTVTVRGRALAPGRATVTATLGSTGKSTGSTVGGLVLSEVRAGEAGDTDQRQWIEIANLTDVAIDLSKYSIGAGKTDYARMRLPLTMTVPAKGCVVVGGPQATVTNQPPYDQAQDLDPDLNRGIGEGYGIALFDNTADRITDQLLPYDVLVYGDDNNVLRGPDGQIVPAVARPPTNGTYFRTSESRWSTQAAATPRICEVQ